MEDDGPVLLLEAVGACSPLRSSHNCHQGAAAARSVGFCKRASQKGSVPSRGCLASVPDLFVPWAQSADSGTRQPCLRPQPALPSTGSQNAASQPRSSRSSQRPVRERQPGLRSGFQAPGLPVRSPFVQLRASSRPAMRALPASSSETAWTHSPPECPSGRCRPGRRGAASVCARRPAAPRGGLGAAPALATRPGLAGEGRRLGSPLPRGAEPPRSSSSGASFPSVSLLVLAGAAQTCSGAAAPRSDRLGAAPPGPRRRGGRERSP